MDIGAPILEPTKGYVKEIRCHLSCLTWWLMPQCSFGQGCHKEAHSRGAFSPDPRGIYHSQYADDTIIMIDGSDRSILNLKLILYCFEWLSGLKINFHKSEVYVFGVDQPEKKGWKTCSIAS